MLSHQSIFVGRPASNVRVAGGGGQDYADEKQDQHVDPACSATATQQVY
jgi:hypothetical protein